MSDWSTHKGLEHNMRNFGLAFDDYARAVCTIDENHKLVHDGMFFNTSGKQTGWTDGTSKSFLISPPAGCFPHVQTMILNFGRGDIDFVAYEGPTVTDNGSALTAVNVNCSSTNTADLALYAEPTVSDNGTHKFTLWVPPTATGNGQSANGIAGVGQGSEWLLNESVPWLIVMTNNSGSTIDWSYEFSWYELNYDRTEQPSPA